MAVETGPRRARITGEWYDRMVETGAFPPGCRVELIDGEILEMTPQTPEHIDPISQLTRILVGAYPPPFVVQGRSTTSAGDSRPDPDLVVLARKVPGRLGRVADPVLIVEVAHTTLAYDQGEKAALYAREGVRDYWVVDTRGRRAFVSTETRDGTYPPPVEVKEGDVLTLPGLDVSVPVGEILPVAR